MTKPALITVGVILVLLGGLWTFQGLGYVGGSPMTGQDLWAIIGPIVAGLGLALALVAWRGSSRG